MHRVSSFYEYFGNMKANGIILWLLLIAVAAGSQPTLLQNKELLLGNPPFSACHASTIVELGDHSLMVAFFAGSGEGNKDVRIWLTTGKSGHWKKPEVIADGVINDTPRYACWNPVLFRSRKGKLYLFYKVGPNPREWWGMMRSSTNDGKDWSVATRLPKGFLGPIKNKPIELSDGSLLCPSSIETDSSWKVQMEQYSDANNTWKAVGVDTASSFRVIQPSVLQLGGDSLEILCRSDQDVIVAAWSNNEGRSWSNFKKLDVPNPNSGIDAVTLKNGMQLLVYNPTTKGKDWFNGRSRLNVAISKDGLTWKDVAVLEDGKDDADAEFSYPAVIQTADGKVHITYTYKRKNIQHVVLSGEALR